MSPLALLAALTLAPAWAGPGTTTTTPDPAKTMVNGTDPNQSGPSQSDIARFAALKSRWLQQQGVPASLAGGTVPTVPPPPPGTPPKAEPTYEQAEAERRAAFDKQFGDGSYDGFVGFEKKCMPPACDKLATGQIFLGANDFVALQKDVDARVVAPNSDAYQHRHADIKTGMRAGLEELRPQPNGDPAVHAELIKVSEPIVKRIFSPEELLQYAQTNAKTADTAPYYAFLGKTLNAAGSPGPAKQAFDQALARDARYEPALAGRAESSYRLGDFPSAVRDARSALKLQPDDRFALTTLKFSEDRVAGAGGGGPGGAMGAPGEVSAGLSAASAGNPAAAPGAGPSALAPAAAENARRSSSLVDDARRALRVGDLASAAEALRRATELDPKNAKAFSLAAIVAIRRKDYPAALSYAEAGLALAPNNAGLNDVKSFALNHTKDYGGARAAADRALALNPKDSFAYFNRAAAMRGLGETDWLEPLRQAARLDPKFAPALDAALRLPTDADLVYLFPGDSALPEPAEPAAPAPYPAWALIAGGAAAGLGVALVALLLFRRSAPEARRSAAPPLATPRWIPQRLAGKYEVGRELGSGAMGVVYEGFDSSLGRPVAIKRLRPELRVDPKESARFLSEARMVARLKHPNIVEVYAVVDEGGELFLVFERVTGTTLYDVLAREKRLPFQKARDLFRGVCAALDEAHKRAVVHRDLKPANVMIEPSGRCRVMDFGIARLAEDAVSRVTRTVAGTPLYMAPEQEQGVARRESDLFAAGVVLYEALTGARPFDGVGPGLLMNKLHKAYEPASARMAKAPAGLDEFFARALEPDPDKRFPTAVEFLRALESLDSV